MRVNDRGLSDAGALAASKSSSHGALGSHSLRFHFLRISAVPSLHNEPTANASLARGHELLFPKVGDAIAIHDFALYSSPAGEAFLRLC